MNQKLKLAKLPASIGFWRGRAEAPGEGGKAEMAFCFPLPAFSHE
jgi:hypothetical protein